MTQRELKELYLDAINFYKNTYERGHCFYICYESICTRLERKLATLYLYVYISKKEEEYAIELIKQYHPEKSENIVKKLYDGRIK